MAVLGKKKKRVSDGVPMSSTADIAFLLLIFFLVTTTFPKDKGLSIVLPEPGEEAQVSQKNILHLIIMPTGIVDVKRGESQPVAGRGRIGLDDVVAGLQVSGLDAARKLRLGPCNQAVIDASKLSDPGQYRQFEGIRN